LARRKVSGQHRHRIGKSMTIIGVLTSPMCPSFITLTTPSRDESSPSACRGNLDVRRRRTSVDERRCRTIGAAFGNDKGHEMR